MKIRSILLAFVIYAALFAFPFSAQSADPWQNVGDGIDYQEFHTSQPNDIYVARMDRANTHAILDSAIAQGRISYGTEKVTEMYQRYDDAINFWGSSWGQRNKVVVAINGSYFNSIGAPESGQISSGWYAKRFSDLTSGSGLAYRLDRSVFIGQCVYTDLSKQSLSIVRSGQAIDTLRIDGLNIPRGNNQLILYTPQYDDFTHTAADGLEVLVEMTRPTLVIPSPANSLGTVRKILDHQGQTPIPFDSVVLSASGSVRDSLLASLQVGDEIHISQEITSFDKDCVSPYDENWTKTYAGISGAFNILRDGQIISDDEAGAVDKNPRTAMAYNDQYIFFVVVDGRTQRSVGMSFDQLAAFLRDSLGATWAIAQDGGGSSVMVINGQIKNHPVSSCYSIFLPVTIGGGSAQPQPAPTQAASQSSAAAAPSDVIPSLFACERSVSNAMLMIDVQPAQWSQAFHPGDHVSTQTTTSIRLGPGTNYPAFTSLPAGTQGVILPHVENLDGIQAKGTYWWKASFGGSEGWVDGSSILANNTVHIIFPVFR